MHEDHIEPVSVVQRKCCVRVLRRCTLNGLGSSLSCASVQGSVRAQRRSGPQVRAVGMCRHHTAPGLHARELVPAVRAVACCCVAALNGKRRVALAAEPAPGRLAMQKFLACVSPARKVAARVAATPLRWPRCYDDDDAPPYTEEGT